MKAGDLGELYLKDTEKKPGASCTKAMDIVVQKSNSSASV